MKNVQVIYDTILVMNKHAQFLIYHLFYHTFVKNKA